MIDKIYLSKIVGEKAIDPDQGEQIKKLIAKSIKSGNKVEIYFDGITSILSMFLNPAIGDLYDIFTEEEIKEKLSVKNVPNEYLSTLNNVVVRAKKYYKSPSDKTAMLNEVLDDE